MQLYQASAPLLCKSATPTAPATGWPAACEGAASRLLLHVLTAAAPPVARVHLAALAAPPAAHLQPQS